VNVRSAEHTALAKEIAAASSVLLKNTRVLDSTTGTTLRGLPAVRGVAKSVAIIGQDAKMPKVNCNELNECNKGTMVIGLIRSLSLFVFD
jgi:beta-glucosidase